MKDSVEFRSDPANYAKEQSGAKQNTLRQLAPNDERFSLLRKGVRKITIKHTETLASFSREISDYTEWKGWGLISWKPTPEQMVDMLLEDEEFCGRLVAAFNSYLVKANPASSLQRREEWAMGQALYQAADKKPLQHTESDLG